MIVSTRPRALALTSATAAVLLLAGCSSEEEGTASPATSSADSSSSASASATGEDAGSEDLSPGLLPEDAFGADAVVTQLTEAQLRQGAAAAGDPASLTVTPESCAQAVQESQPGVEDLDAFAAQSITSGTTSTVELISTGGAIEDPIGSLSEAAGSCPEATISSPEIGTATVTFRSVDVPDLGDGSAAIAYTTTVTGPDGNPLAIPALVGLVQDGDRLLTLVSLAATGEVDEAAFGALLEQAFDHQADALG